MRVRVRVREEPGGWRPHRTGLLDRIGVRLETGILDRVGLKLSIVFHHRKAKRLMCVCARVRTHAT